MSRLSRGRKGKKARKSPQRSVLPNVVGVRDECDCLSCSGWEFDPALLIDNLLAAELLDVEDPLDAELAGAVLVSLGELIGERFEEALTGGFIPALEARASAEALAMLLALSSVVDGPAREAAMAAADRLAGTGVPRPNWAAELAEPVSVTECWRVADQDEMESMLVCALERAGRSHALAMTVKHLHCGAASEIFLLDPDELPSALETVQAGIRSSGHEAICAEVAAGELRWLAEQALDARAVHESAAFGLGINPLELDDDLAEYRTMAVLLRARCNAFPAPVKPVNVPPGYEEGHPTEFTGSLLAGLAGNGNGPLGAPGQVVPLGPAAVATLPPKRKKSAPPAPIFQVKVGLRGAKPPIWRRLEIPADTSLARLHDVIQVAFDWHGGHLHVFETEYGEFGIADAELGHSPEAPVTLEQVAPAVGSKIRYTYDFGDDWVHDIVVEKILERDSAAGYPRCTGGRRAAPPDDCGGIWGYAELVEILGDPTHPEHDDRLEWLGLDNAAEFEPGDFDAKSVADALSRLRC
jgi:Plasmid pRiA4b ORF-3-like protein